MKNIKTIAGEILLYLYLLQRQDVGRLKNATLSFTMWHLPKEQEGSGARLDERAQSIFRISDFDSYTDNDLYNSLVYLHDAGLVEYKDSQSNMGSTLFNFKVTASGIDIVESIDRGEEEKKNFNITFNFNITNDVTVESLLKAEFGSLIKASLT